MSMNCDHCRVLLEFGVGEYGCRLGIEKLRLRVKMKEKPVADTNLDHLRKSRKDMSYR